MSPYTPVSPVRYATSPLVNLTMNPIATPPYPVTPGTPGGSINATGMLLGCTACTPVIRTEAPVPPRLTARVAPGPNAAVHADGVGTVVSFSKPPVAHGGVAAPRIA